MKEQFNLNSAIALVVAFVNILMFIIGTFLWSSITKAQDSLAQLNVKMAAAIENQVHMQRSLENMMPRTEIELRLKAVDIEIIAIKTRIQQTDASLLRFQKDQKP